MASKSQSAVVVPLYQYPLTEETWEPLHKAILNYPLLTFVVIINPNSGPGVGADGWLPDPNYTQEIPKFTSHVNVILVGYVRLDYCRRKLAEVETDIKKYGNWARSGSSFNASMLPTNFDGESGHQSKDYGKSGLGVQGIFFDETPNLFDEDTAAYLDAAGRIVKATEGILYDRLVIHNPGTVPDPEYTPYWQQKQIESQVPRMPPLPPRQTSHPISVSGPIIDSSHSRNAKTNMGDTGLTRTVPENRCCGAPDITTVFESSHALWLDMEVQKRLSDLLRHQRQQCCYMVHSVPLDLVMDVTMVLRERGMYVFVTDLCEHYYETFGKSWEVFVETMTM